MTNRMTAEQLLAETTNLDEKITIGRGKQKQKMWIPILTQVLEHFMIELMGSDFNKVNVKLSFNKMPRGHYGNTVFKVGEKKNFNLQISDDTSFDMMVIGLAHEITHIAQVYKGDLEFTSVDQVLWHGEAREVDPTTVIGSKNFDFKAYLALPWEKSARDNESILSKLAKDKFKDYRLPDMDWLPLFD
jgi:hypothetical protein